MKRGLYRYTDPDGEAGTCVHWTAGDGAPFLSRSIYEMLGFRPSFDELPEIDEFLRTHADAPVPLFLRALSDSPVPAISA